jgi:hypothetical protein
MQERLYGRIIFYAQEGHEMKICKEIANSTGIAGILSMKKYQ